MPWTVSNMDVVIKNVVRLVIDSRNGKENQSWKKKYGRVRKVINIFLWKVRLLILIQLKRKSKNLDYQGDECYPFDIQQRYVKFKEH